MIEPGDPGAGDAGFALLVAIDDWRGALPVTAVREVARAVAITPVSGGGLLLGFIDVRGEIIPVADSRAALHLPPREPRLTDRFVLISCASGSIAVPVDDTLDVVRITSTVPGPRGADGSEGLSAIRVRGRDADVVAFVDPDALFGRLVVGWSGA